ncbi:MAG: hypothetical protein N2504_00405 [candidate division WOR-3 bacterium]|nr:hypothetical protein [candidate division WOR-3 bacterium]MCX7947036.1 hypothetical protein [candidate division WOR-3 bacterium]MDW8149923.1 hypothetical protein [candidate division WOR-3 bacterium]
MIALIINLENLKICVYDKETKQPLEAVKIYSPISITFTDHSGCANVKYKDSIIIYRIGYKMLKFKENVPSEIYLEVEGISLKPVEVVSKYTRLNEVRKLDFDLENTMYGSVVNKPIISGFNRDKYNITVDGAILHDQSDYLDHPIVMDFELADKIYIGNTSTNAIFGINSVAGGLDLRIFDITNENRYVGKFSYLSSNDRFSVLFKDNRNFKNFSYKVGIKGSISGDFKNPEIENTSDSSIYSILSAKYKKIMIGNYFSFINYGVPSLEESKIMHGAHGQSRAKNIYLNPRLSYNNFILDFQNSDQREYDGDELITQLNLRTIQTIYNSNNFYLNLNYSDFLSKGEDKYNYNRIILSTLYSNKFKNLNYAFSIIPSYSSFDEKLKIGYSFLIGTKFSDFNFSLSQSIQYPSLQQLTFEGIHKTANRYEIPNPSLKEELLLSFHVDYKHSLNFIMLNVNPSISYIKNYISLKFANDTIEGYPAYTWENKDIYIFNSLLNMNFIPFNNFFLSTTLEYSKPSVEIEFYTKPQLRTRLSYKFITLYHRAFFDEKSKKLFSIFSLGIDYNIRRISLNFSINNLFNEKYIEPTNPFKTFEPFRNFSISISI